MELNIKLVVYCLVISIISKQIHALDSSINQNINQAIKGTISGAVNQIISQDIKESQGSSATAAVNQNINQDIEGCVGNASESINQNIHQKVARGSTLIDQKTIKEIKNRHTSCDNEFIIKRHRSNCGCKDRDSSEEIKVCDGKHTSEIIIKNRETNCKDISEDNSDEITIKYGCDAGKKEESKCESSEESEEIIVKRPKPCGLKSSEEVDIKTWIRPCSKCQFKDVSSEEVVKPACPVKEKESTGCGSSEEHIIEDSQEEEDSFESKPKLPPCKCKHRMESSEELFGYLKAKPCSSPICSASSTSSTSSASSESEESLEIQKPCKKPKTCTCNKVTRKIIVKPSSEEKESEEISGGCDRWSWIRPKPIRRPALTCGCKKRQPKRKCPTCKQESSVEQQAIFY